MKHELELLGNNFISIKKFTFSLLFTFSENSICSHSDPLKSLTATVYRVAGSVLRLSNEDGYLSTITTFVRKFSLNLPLKQKSYYY